VETVAFPLEDGGQVLVRVAAVEPTNGGVVTRGGRAEEVVAEARQSFESALGTIREVADAVLHQLARLAVSEPSRV
jgi:phosphoribosylamine-glycine ligase